MHHPRNMERSHRRRSKVCLEKETIRRYGENWQDVKIKEDIHPVSGSFLNENAYIPAIKDAAAGWIIVNKNGYLFYMGVWAEKLEEPEFKPFQKVLDRKSTRLNSSHVAISYAVFCL